jgi:CheY-like chemotaxis protein
MMMQDKHKIPITILICDDDDDDRALTRQALEDAHISNDLRFVEDGEQLLDYLYQRGEYSGETGAAPRPGLILLDLNMPKMDGREALQHIKGDPTLVDIPIVILTTSGLDLDIIRSYQLGVNSFITKPVTFSWTGRCDERLGPLLARDRRAAARTGVGRREPHCATRSSACRRRSGSVIWCGPVVILRRGAPKGSLSRHGRKSPGWTAILSSLRDSG